MKRILIICLTVAAVAFAGALASAQNTPSGEVPDSFIIDTKNMQPKDRKPGVGFTHKKHSVDYKITCTDCHHDYKDGKNVWKEGDKVEKCVACHDMKKKKGKAPKLMNAMHKNCQGCHKDLKKAGKPHGPTRKCNDCHTGELPK